MKEFLDITRQIETNGILELESIPKSENQGSVMSYLDGYYYKQFCKDGLQGTIETYCALYFAICHYQREFTIPWENPEEEADKEILRRFLFMVLADHPEFFYVSWEQTTYSFDGVSAKIDFKYGFGKEACRKLQRQIRNKVLYVTFLARCCCGKSKLEQIKYLYCCFVKHMTYAGKELKSSDAEVQCRIHSAAGALLDKKAVCDGMARGFKMLLDELGIENRVIRQNIRDGMEYSHEWNVITWNGEEFHADITWERDLYSQKKQVLYRFFMVSQDKMQELHRKTLH